MAKEINLKVEVLNNAGDLSRWLTDQEKKQLPFANALALTRTAQSAQKSVRNSLPVNFNIRNKGLVLAGVRHQPAEKKAWPRQESAVFIPARFRFLADHEAGVVRKPSKGHRMTIPKAIKRTTRGKIPAAKTPTKLRAKKSVYTTDGSFAEIRRKVRKGAKDRRAILYLLRRRVKIKPRMKFAWTVREKVAHVHRREFRKAWKKVMGLPRYRRGLSSAAGEFR
jgi:hypothetical protein